MMTQSKHETYGLKRSVLIVACLFMITAYACGKNETDQASKTVSKTLEQVGDSAGNVTEKTKEMANEAVKSAEKMVDKTKETAKDAYDAAGNVVQKTADKAGDTYKEAGDMVNKAVSNTDNE